MVKLADTADASSTDKLSNDGLLLVLASDKGSICRGVKISYSQLLDLGLSHVKACHEMTSRWASTFMDSFTIHHRISGM
jgi:hypothetical protein